MTQLPYKAFIEPEPQTIQILPSCRLRTFRRADIPLLHRFMSDPSVWHFFGDELPSQYTERDAASHLAWLHARPRLLVYAAADLESDTLLGFTSAQFSDAPHAFNAELTGWLGRPHWGSGIAREVTSAFTNWLFEKHHALRVFAAPFHANRASIGALQASGFTFEGRLRNSVFKNGQLMDQMMYAKLNPACETLPRAPSRPSREQLAARRAKRQARGTQPPANADESAQ
jgi:[ribosomal protein S5]-alanine N-acetyltransferase